MRVQLRFITALMICFCLTVMACDTEKENNDNNLLLLLLAGGKTYAIGDTGPSGVGIVFYITDEGLHGLEVAPVDQTEQAWITGGSTQTTLNGNTSTDIGTGSANTDAIIAQTDHTASAAQICRDYRATEEGDWFLPSKDELQEIWWNLVSDRSAENDGRGKPHAGSLGDFAGGYYWSSSEGDATNAWTQLFINGDQYDSASKDGALYVRAVRAF